MRKRKLRKIRNCIFLFNRRSNCIDINSFNSTGLLTVTKTLSNIQNDVSGKKTHTGTRYFRKEDESNENSLCSRVKAPGRHMETYILA